MGPFIIVLVVLFVVALMLAFYVIGPLEGIGSWKEPIIAVVLSVVWGIYGAIYFTRNSKKKGKRQKRRRLAPVWRGIIETGFILFLFYSNLLMGEFTRSNAMHGRSLVLAVFDIFTLTNLWIGTVSALIGYVVVEFLRGKI